MSQRDEAWFAARVGRITASMMHVVMLPRERGEYKSGPRKGQPREIRIDLVGVVLSDGGLEIEHVRGALT